MTTQTEAEWIEEAMRLADSYAGGPYMGGYYGARSDALRAHLATRPQVPEAVQVWCDTCEGTGRVYQESQRGVIGSGGAFACPDCDARGFNVRHMIAAATGSTKWAE